ncbi:hypothetical protein [Streptomyces yaizuensis]|uniref:Secreted protein n=1 Tax=Streptomyces yaizuensis TaxID=2989713 RepID=A0ABQ5NYZ7_9ACTN|nr:hypothetical protein [Streptomyces sp. YSPA8]GLF95181.1 hypothetical protein SYYSPA8_12810 [Streptomyces sp. YSPA8]
MTPLRNRGVMRFGGLIAAAVCAALGTLAVAQAAPQDTPGQARPPAVTDMPVAVEDFVHPGADAHLAERGITLQRGDGGITLTDCKNDHDIQIESFAGANYFCFSVTGKQGYLAMELPDVFAMWTKDHPVRAKLTAEGETHFVDAAKNKYTPIGENSDLGKPSVLLELRLTS